MKKHLFLVSAILMVATLLPAVGQNTYTVQSKLGNGQAVSSRTINDRGQTQLRRVITFANGRYVDVAEMYAADGSLAWVSEKDTLSGTLHKNSVYMMGRNSKVSSTRGGATNTRLIDHDSRANFRDSALRWFINGRPAAGGTAKFTAFDPVAGTFYRETIRYAGNRRMTFRGRSVVLHVLVGSRENDWIDDKGLVYIAQLKLAGATLIRR